MQAETEPAVGSQPADAARFAFETRQSSTHKAVVERSYTLASVEQPAH